MKKIIGLIMVRVCALTVSIMFIMSIKPVRAANLPPCDQRPTTIQDSIAVDHTQYCLESVIDASDAGELAFTAIVAGEDGMLYAARPLTGEVFALVDQDGDGLPETPERIIDGLTLPNALAYADGALYIAAGDAIYRWRDDALETLTDALPQTGEGFWTGGLTVSDDGRIFAGLGANCDFCEPDAGRGVIWQLSAEPDVEPTIAAHGLRYPQALYAHGDVLWIGDITHDSLERGRFDEVNRLSFTAISEGEQDTAHFGWPYCLGDGSSAYEGETDERPFDCANAQSAVYMLPSHSTPIALTVYNSDLFSWLQGKLLVALGGSATTSPLEGYALIALTIDDDQTLTEPSFILPFVDQAQALTTERSVNRSLQFDGEGFWPHHLYGLAVSPEGWIYLSVGGGRIYALRPR